MPDVRVNGVSLHYVVHGKGPSVIMVHGSWGDADNWAQVLPLFAEHCQVVAYDRRGHSRSERPPAQGSVHADVNGSTGLVWVLGHTNHLSGPLALLKGRGPSQASWNRLISGRSASRFSRSVTPRPVCGARASTPTFPW